MVINLSYHKSSKLTDSGNRKWVLLTERFYYITKLYINYPKNMWKSVLLICRMTYIYRWMRPTQRWPVAATVRWWSWRRCSRDRRANSPSPPTTKSSSSSSFAPRSPTGPSGNRCGPRVRPYVRRTGAHPRCRLAPPYRVARRCPGDMDSSRRCRCRTMLCTDRTL